MERLAFQLLQMIEKSFWLWLQFQTISNPTRFILQKSKYQEVKSLILARLRLPHPYVETNGKPKNVKGEKKDVNAIRKSRKTAKRLVVVAKRYQFFAFRFFFIAIKMNSLVKMLFCLHTLQLILHTWCV